MNCGRCTFLMNQFGFTYLCSHCGMLIDEFKGLCVFHVGKYRVVLKDYYFNLPTPTSRTFIYKDILKSVQLEDELPLDVDEDVLDRIWKQFRGEE